MYKNPEPPQELLECFDENKNLIEPHTREEVHKEPLKYWHAVVNVWLIDKSGRMVCSLRSKSLSGNPGKWQTYFGGHIQAGVSFKETAVRELEEEIGLNIEPAKLFMVTSGKHVPSKHFFESYVFLFNGNLEDLKFNDGEIDKTALVSFEEYNKDKELNPDKWCNGCNLENQQRIKEWLKKNN